MTSISIWAEPAIYFFLSNLFLNLCNLGVSQFVVEGHPVKPWIHKKEQHFTYIYKTLNC